jgi:hypothetical protein
VLLSLVQSFRNKTRYLLPRKFRVLMLNEWNQ